MCNGDIRKFTLALGVGVNWTAKSEPMHFARDETSIKSRAVKLEPWYLPDTPDEAVRWRIC